jgi:hypothetical protein
LNLPEFVSCGCGQTWPLNNYSIRTERVGGIFGLFGGQSHNMLYYSCPRCGQEYYLDLGSGPVSIEQVSIGQDLRIGSMTISSGSQVNVSGRDINRYKGSRK